MSLSLLPLEKTVTPTTQAELADAVRQAYEVGAAIYPLGGATALDFGVQPAKQGWGLSLAQLQRVVDYPARDTTITIEAGMPMALLASILAPFGQRLPIDVPQAEIATIGGVVATNTNGPRRFKWGTIRDYVIGISGVDGRGVSFKAGGRVVKNVAGYDLCKLLTGSLGTLATITQVTLKVIPQAQASYFLAVDLTDQAQADLLLDHLVRSKTTPVAIELLGGPAWQNNPDLGTLPHDKRWRLVVGLEGTRVEVDWMFGQLESEWAALGVTGAKRIVSDGAVSLWDRLIEFPAHPTSPVVLKASLLPSKLVRFLELLRADHKDASVQAHAGDGVAYMVLSRFDATDIDRLLEKWQPAAREFGGNLVVWSRRASGTWGRLAHWGVLGEELRMMQEVKQSFDPKGLLNPGRFVYDS